MVHAHPPSPPVVFVGAATMDAIALVDHFPASDERQVARELATAGGGPSATAAVAAVRLGISAAVVSTVGDDDEGTRIVEGLRDEGVDVTGITVACRRRSGASVVIVDGARGTRATCTRAAPPVEIADGSTASALIRDAPWVHVDHLGWAPVSALRRDLPRGARPRVSVEAGNPIPGLGLEDVDLFAPTLDALTRMYGDLPDHDLLDAALDAGCRWVVATCGSKGCVAATADGERHAIPRHPVEVRSTLGAGDVFHGALLAGLVRGMPLASALAYANVAAALSCRGLDGRSAIPSHDQVLEQLARTCPLTTAQGDP